MRGISPDPCACCTSALSQPQSLRDSPFQGQAGSGDASAGRLRCSFASQTRYRSAAPLVRPPAGVAFRLCRGKVPRPRRCSRVTTRATVGREESLSASSPQRPICSRRRPYLPAAVPAQWLRLMVFRQARYCHHFTCRRRLPLAARLTFLSRETVWAVFGRSVVADNALTIKQKSTLPVSKTRQDKSLFRSLSGAYLPPLGSGFVPHLLCSHLALMGFRRTCASTIRHRLPLAPVIRST